MDLIKESQDALSFLKHTFIGEKVSVIIPCFNEEKTVGQVVRSCLSSRMVGEVIVVDDGSTDGSARIARDCGAKVLRHAKNKGKGAAILCGAKNARNSVLVFIDADFINVNPESVEALAVPVIKREVKVCKAGFDRDEGKVTELTAKPLLEFFFPEVTLQQPLSGQFAIRKEFLLELDTSTDWGIDLGIVLESIKVGERVSEVNIGRIEHKHRPLDELSKTARQVTRTILEKAGFLAKKHKLILFDFDKTLIRESSISAIAHHAGIVHEVESEREKYFSGRITERELTRRIARLLKGVPTETIQNAVRGIKKQHFADETLVYLKRMGYKIAVISFAFEQVVTSCFNRKLFDAVICPVLEEKDGAFTGRVLIPKYWSGRNVFCKGRAARSLMRKLKVRRDETIAVGDSESDERMFEEVGVPVAFNPRKKLRPVHFKIKSLSSIIIIAN